jgi:hypothetical protein
MSNTTRPCPPQPMMAHRAGLAAAGVCPFPECLPLRTVGFPETGKRGVRSLQQAYRNAARMAGPKWTRFRCCGGCRRVAPSPAQRGQVYDDGNGYGHQPHAEARSCWAFPSAQVPSSRTRSAFGGRAPGGIGAKVAGDPCRLTAMGPAPKLRRGLSSAANYHKLFCDNEL